MAQFALRWILMFDAVSCVIPGARNERQAKENAAAASLAALDAQEMDAVRRVYEELVRPYVHARW
jgi:aryl-alcohol dehydrogenase-like predicted oxidoreductase